MLQAMALGGPGPSALARVSMRPQKHPTMKLDEGAAVAADRTPLQRVPAWVTALLLMALTVIPYLPAVKCGFIWDDDAYVQENQTLRSASGLHDIWLRIGATPQYYPLVFTTFWLEYHFWGLNPVGYHLVNILLHAVAVVLLWRVLKLLNVPGGLLAAAIFAIHPVQVESVVWITERKNVLSACFYFAAAYTYLRWAMPTPDQRPSPGGRLYLASLLLFLCALGSKTVTVSLPAALILVLWWKGRRITWRTILPLAPMFVIGVLAGLLTSWMEEHHVAAFGKEWSFSFVERCLIAGRAIWFYVAKLFWPVELTFIYPRWVMDGTAWQPYLYPIAAVAVVIALWATRRWIGKGPLTAALYFAGTLFPALGFFNIYPMRYSFVADHFQYLAGVGVVVLGVAAACWVFGRSGKIGRRLSRILPLPLMAALGLLSWRQAGIYADVETLWRDTISKNPGAWMAHCNLGFLLASRGRLDEAVSHYNEALRLKPDDAKTLYDLGVALDAQGKSDEALICFRRAVEAKPSDPTAQFDLALSLQSHGDLSQAIEHYREAIRLRPNYAKAHCYMGIALQSLGRFDEAVEQYIEALDIDPDMAGAHYALGAVLQSRGRFDEAIQQYRTALQGEPDFAQARYALATALQAKGSLDEAIAHYRFALQRMPDSAPAMNDLAWLLATHPNGASRRPAEAVSLAERVANLTGRRNPAVLDTLAVAYAAAGQFEQAVQAAEEALAITATVSNSRLDREIRQRLELYKQRIPFTPTTAEPPSPAP